MYNRYMRNDSGVYTRMPQSDAPLPAGGSAQGGPHSPPPPGSRPSTGPRPSPEPKPSPGPPPMPAPAHRPERDILNRFLENGWMDTRLLSESFSLAADCSDAQLLALLFTYQQQQGLSCKREDIYGDFD